MLRSTSRLRGLNVKAESAGCAVNDGAGDPVSCVLSSTGIHLVPRLADGRVKTCGFQEALNRMRNVSSVRVLPSASLGTRWEPVLDTTHATGSPAPNAPPLSAFAACSVGARSLLLLRRTA